MQNNVSIDDARSIQEEGIETLLGLIRRRHAIHLRYSSGKDSTSCAVLVIEAVRRAVAEGITTTHYISSSSTGIDNPAVEMHLFAVQDEMREHFEKHSLPIEVHLTHPTLASSFMVTTIGRGTLPRFPENSAARQCAADWKYAPAQRLASELQRLAIEQTGREIVTVIGTRLEKKTVWFDETDHLSVDAEMACAFITCTYPTMAIECDHLQASESAAFWLNEGIITLPAGHAARYQEIALRNRYFANLAQRFDLTAAELNRYLVQNSITNAEHEKLLSEVAATAAGLQPDMFTLPLAA
jgi:hypothetical protein